MVGAGYQRPSHHMKLKIVGVLAFMALVASHAFASTVVYEAPETLAVKKIETVEVKEPKTWTPDEVKQELKIHFADAPIMVEIARCESQFRHYMADGSTLRGRVDNADTGVFQINKRFHEKRAVSLGLDINTLAGNIAYARLLYEEQGTRPWNASAHCW